MLCYVMLCYAMLCYPAARAGTTTTTTTTIIVIIIIIIIIIITNTTILQLAQATLHARLLGVRRGALGQPRLVYTLNILYNTYTHIIISHTLYT